MTSSRNKLLVVLALICLALGFSTLYANSTAAGIPWSVVDDGFTEFGGDPHSDRTVSVRRSNDATMDGYLLVKAFNKGGTLVDACVITHANLKCSVVVPAGGSLKITDPNDLNTKGAAGTLTVS